MPERRIILFELNEVPYRVADDFCRAHPRAHLRAIMDQASQYETVTRDRVLSPWVTWPTVHRGVSDSNHGLGHFGQDLARADAATPPVWHILARHGIRSGIFGSLHSYPMPDDVERYDFYVPDTFAPESVAHPPELAVFQDFNLTMARRSPRNVSTEIPLRPAARLLPRLASLGLQPRTLADTARQLLDERASSWKRVRRRTYQSVLAFDVFLRQLASKTPLFSTFFTNHVASAMHRYWAAAYPSDYATLDFTPDWIARYRGEIDFAMRKLDVFLGSLLRFLNRNREFVLVIASSMGQASAISTPISNQLYVTDLPRFMNAMGVGTSDWTRRPAMEPTVSVYVSDARAPSFRETLRTLHIAGEALTFDERENGFFSLTFGHPNLPDTVGNATLSGGEVSFTELGLEKVPIEDESNSSGYHVREGMLLVFDPQARGANRDRRRTDTTEIAPAILATYDLPLPPYMTRPSFTLV